MKPVTSALAIMAAGGVLGLGARTLELGGVSAMGLAAVLLGLISVTETGWPLKLTGALLVLLGGASAVLGIMAGGWGWALALPSALLAVLGVVLWRSRREPAARDGLRAPAQDPWRRLDAGDDPTADR